MATEREQLDVMTDYELTSYWNILQFPCFRIGALADNKQERHELIVGSLLTERAIPHEKGKRIVPVAA